MSSATIKRPKNFKSKIPVPIFKVNSLIESDKNREIAKTISSKPETTSNKSAANCPHLLKENCKTQFVKPLSKKIYKRNGVSKSQCLSTQCSSKIFRKNSIVSRKPKEKILLLKENKPSYKAKKDGSTELFKKVTEKNSVNGEIKKAKPLADQKSENSNASLPTSNVRGIQTENKCVKNKNMLCASRNMLGEKSKEKFVTSDFSAQKDIKFESNEIFRQMILRGRQLSPSVCKLVPGVKLSSVTSHRSSAYDQVFEVHPDPHKHAVQTIEKMSAKMAAFPAGGYRKLSTQIERMPLSPSRMKNSLYTPGVNPEQKVMKSLEAIRAKQMQKSALKSAQKKVTFNFNIEEFSAKVELSPKQKSFANSEDKLTQISEGSSENTPSSPLRNHNSSNGEEEEKNLNSSKLKSLNEHDKLTELGNCHEHTINSSDEDSEINVLVDKYMNVLRPSKTNDLLIADCNKTPFCSSKKISSVYRNSNSKLKNEALSCQKTNLQDFSKFIHQSKERTSKMKLCTPRPVSYSRLLHNWSPDFLEEKNLVNLSSLAPIYTPLVLKNIAKGSAESPENLSPVKLKLDFAATENDTPKKERKIQVPFAKNIATATQILDNLADKECDIFLSNEKCAVLCGRYLQNPVALTLTEGDEMHFVPVRL